MHESDSEVSTIEEETSRGVIEEENMSYNCETRNRFENMWVGRENESDRRDDNRWKTARRNKRKRHNTGSVDMDHFHSLNKDEQLSAIFAKLIDIERSHHALHGLEPVVNNNVERVQAAETYIDTNTRRIKMLAYKQIDIETKQKQNNLIFRGIKDVRNENVYEAIDDLLRERLQVDTGVVYIEQAYRLGSYRKAAETAKYFNDVPRRPILVSFRHHEDAEMVLSRAKNLRGTRYSIDRDYPTEIVAARRRIWADFKRLRSENPQSNVVLKYPARIEVDGNTVYDQFPDWNELNRERATCDYTHTHERPAPLPKQTRPRVVHHNPTRKSREQPRIDVYDADTESEPDQHQHRKQPNTQMVLPSFKPRQPVETSNTRVVSQPTQTLSDTMVIPSSDDDESQSQSLLNPATINVQNTSSSQGQTPEFSYTRHSGENQNTNIVTRDGSMCYDVSGETPQLTNENSGNGGNGTYVTGEPPSVVDPTQSQHDTGQGQKH